MCALKTLHHFIQHVQPNGTRLPPGNLSYFWENCFISCLVCLVCLVTYMNLGFSASPRYIPLGNSGLASWIGLKHTWRMKGAQNEKKTSEPGFFCWRQMMLEVVPPTLHNDLHSHLRWAYKKKTRKKLCWHVKAFQLQENHLASALNRMSLLLLREKKGDRNKKKISC